MAACSGGKEIDTEQTVQNETDILEERRAEREAEEPTETVSNDNQTIVDMYEPVDTMENYGLDLSEHTDFGLSTGYEHMNEDELKVWSILSNSHENVTYDKSIKTFFILQDTEGQIEEIASMLNSKEHGEQFFNYYREVNENMNLMNEGYTLILLNPKNVYNALFIIKNGVIEYSVFDDM